MRFRRAKIRIICGSASRSSSVFSAFIHSSNVQYLALAARSEPVVFCYRTRTYARGVYRSSAPSPRRSTRSHRERRKTTARIYNQEAKVSLVFSLQKAKSLIGLLRFVLLFTLCCIEKRIEMSDTNPNPPQSADDDQQDDNANSRSHTTIASQPPAPQQEQEQQPPGSSTQLTQLLEQYQRQLQQQQQSTSILGNNNNNINCDTMGTLLAANTSARALHQQQFAPMAAPSHDFPPHVTTYTYITTDSSSNSNSNSNSMTAEQEEQAPHDINIETRNNKNTNTDGSSRLLNEREQFFYFIKILLRLFEQPDNSTNDGDRLRAQATLVIRDCTRRNRRGEAAYTPLIAALERRLRPCRGMERYWRRAETALRRCLQLQAARARETARAVPTAV